MEDREDALDLLDEYGEELRVTPARLVQVLVRARRDQDLPLPEVLRAVELLCRLHQLHQRVRRGHRVRVVLVWGRCGAI